MCCTECRSTFFFNNILCCLDYWHQRADDRYDNPLQCNQKLLVVRDKVGRLQAGEFGVSKSMDCDIFPSVI